MKPRCVVCHEGVRFGVYLCPPCAEQYGNEEWPDWLRFLVGDERRVRGDAARRQGREVPMAGLGPRPFSATDTRLYGERVVREQEGI